VRFLCDVTGLDANAHGGATSRFLDEVFAMIGRRNRIVVVDMFLFQRLSGSGTSPHRTLCEELTPHPDRPQACASRPARRRGSPTP
jgi:hypothetical protein